MAICAPGCAPASIPAMGAAGCNITTRPGGFDRVIFMTCDSVIADLATLSQWQTLIDTDKIHATGRVLGQKPKGSPSKRRVASCVPERTVNYTRQWSWKDSNADNANLTDYEFYSFVDANQDVLKIGFLTCDDLFYGFFDSYSLDVDDTRPETNDEDAVFEVVVEVKSRVLSTPTLIPGLSAILT